MAKSKKLLKSDPVGDLEAQINADFNTVIRKAHSSLGTKTHSPVRTGFFASSWKVSTRGVKTTDDILKFNPWAQMKKAESIAFFTGQTNFRHNPKIQPRFEVSKTYNIKKPVFIGNTVKYASYALEGGKIQNFIQGRLGQIIKQTMKEKKGKLFLASKATSGFGRSGKGVGYSQIDL
jgi:hypothetical protein